MKTLLYLLIVSASLAADTSTIATKTESIVASWVSFGGEMNGIKIDQNFGKTFIKFDDEHVVLNAGEPVKYSIDDTRTPAWIDFHSTPKQEGIFKVVDGNLHICMGRDGHRPTQFKSDEGDNVAYLILKIHKE